MKSVQSSPSLLHAPPVSQPPAGIVGPAQYLLTSRRIVEACDGDGLTLVASKELDGVLSEAKSQVPEACRPSKWKPYPFDPNPLGLTSHASITFPAIAGM